MDRNDDLFDLKEEVYHLRTTLEAQQAAKEAPPKPKHAMEMAQDEYEAAAAVLGLYRRNIY